MKKLSEKIARCCDCPRWSEDKWTCTIANRAVFDSYKIPDWCPLEYADKSAPPAPPSRVPAEAAELEYMDARTDRERAADAKIKSTTTATTFSFTPPPSRAAQLAAMTVLQHQIIDLGIEADHCEDAGLTKEYEQDLRKRIEKLGQVADWLEKGLE